MPRLLRTCVDEGPGAFRVQYASGHAKSSRRGTMPRVTPMPDAQPFISYADAIAGQSDGLRRAHERVASQLAAVAPLPPGARPVLVAMGASHAAAAAGIAALRAGGVAASRVTAGEVAGGVGGLGD